MDEDLAVAVVGTAPAMLRGAVRQSTVRQANLGLVARTVCAAPGPVSRADVAALTAMTRSTVSRLADDLVAGGVLDELGRPATARPGRPAVPLGPGSRIVALGLEVNVGVMAARMYDLAGHLVAEEIEFADLAGSDPTPVLGRLSVLSGRVLDRCPPGARVAGAGLSLPGMVTADGDGLVLAPNLEWLDLRPADHVDPASVAGCRLRVGNDANLAARAVAEPRPGFPGPLRDFVYVCGDAGIGGAAVAHGQIVTGRHGWAGEIGHLCVDPAGAACRCGSRGCLEQYVGVRAMVTAAGLAPSSPPEVLAAAAEGGDPLACRAIEDAARALGLAISAVVNMLDIPDVVLGGHLAVLAELLRPEFEAELARRVITSRWVTPTVHRAEVAVAPGATGAAFAELGRVLADPLPWVDAETA